MDGLGFRIESQLIGVLYILILAYKGDKRG